MLQALDRALSGYASAAADVAQIAERIRRNRVDADPSHALVSLTVAQRAAEANLSVARVADQMGEALLHVIA